MVPTLSNQDIALFCLVIMLHAFSGKIYHWFQVTLDENVPESVQSQLLFSLLFSLALSWVILFYSVWQQSIHGPVPS